MTSCARGVDGVVPEMGDKLPGTHVIRSGGAVAGSNATAAAKAVAAGNGFRHR